MKNASEAGTEIIRRSGILQDISADSSPESLGKQENVEELVNGMADFCAQRLEEGNSHVSLGDFLAEVSLLTDQDSEHDDTAERVTLMTVHSAKGLEFRTVFVVGMEEGLFPSNMCGDSPRALEEERRLFYVAITRAEELCFLTYAKSRYRYGKMEFGSPSRFLHDIDARLLALPQEMKMARMVDGRAENFRKQMGEKLTSFAPRRLRPLAESKDISQAPSSTSESENSFSTAGLRAGQKILHERFGIGHVLRVEGSGDNTKATIHFDNAGDKQLLLRFARFKVVDD